jgi:uncharacterized circularly permuted ATP-grasp superfamily protein/uncharacterized alpha-E superfamily protein
MKLEPIGISAPDAGLLRSYAPPAGGWDEMRAPSGAIRPAWAGLAATLAGLGPGELGRRRSDLAEHMRRDGVTYNVYGDGKVAERPWSLDPVPLVLSSAEWVEVERGLVQRAELLDAVLRDVYGPRKLVREGVLPALFLWSHPGFLRPCVGGPAAQSRMLRSYSADLARGIDGSYRVVSDRGQNPSGYGYALENRAALGRAMPSLFRQAGVHRLEAFFQSLRRGLAEAAPPGAQDPFMVLLSPGSENETYSEQAYLASYLGIPLVRGGDLVPRDGGIHLPSVEGSRPVDVILRRVDDAFCDPLELIGHSLLGVPGLVQAVRDRTVAVCNALGSGILAGSGLMAFLPELCRRLFGQELILPSARTWWCGDARQREEAFADLEGRVVKPLYQGPKRSTWFMEGLSREQRERLLARIRAKPHLYLVQERLGLSTAPCFVDGRLEPRPVVLRSFLAGVDGSFAVMPGGLTRAAGRAGATGVTGQDGGIGKDTWIMASEPLPWAAPILDPAPAAISGEDSAVAGADLDLVQSQSQSQGAAMPAWDGTRDETRDGTRDAEGSGMPRSVPMRTARPHGALPGYASENLFWLGRYQERLGVQLRLWREALSAQGPDVEALGPHWPHLLRAFQPDFGTAEAADTADETDAGATGPEAIRSLEASLEASLDAERTLGSPAYNRAAVRRTARAVRDLLPDDCWRAVNSLLPMREPGATLPWLDQAILQLGGLAGLEADGLALGPVRRFLSLGGALERALCAVRMLEAGLAGVLNPPSGLVAVLLACHDGALMYRQRYPQGPLPSPAAELLLADEANPRSVAFQLARFYAELEHLPPGGSQLLPACRKAVLKALAQARLFEAEANGGVGSPAGNEGFEHLLRSLEAGLGRVSDALAREYFQAIPLPQSMREWG